MLFEGPEPGSPAHKWQEAALPFYLNWKDYGWSLGKVTELITKSTPLLFKKYNVRAIWAVEGRLKKKCKGPCMLDLKMYKSGADAQLDSWVFLDKSMAASDE